MPFVSPSFSKHDNANHSEMNDCDADLAVTASQTYSLSFCGLFVFVCVCVWGNWEGGGS